MSDLAAWVAAQMVLDAVAPIANAARDAIPNAAPDQRDYAQRLSACLDAERDRLGAIVRRLAPPAAPKALSPAEGRPGAPQRRQQV